MMRVIPSVRWRTCGCPKSPGIWRSFLQGSGLRSYRMLTGTLLQTLDEPPTRRTGWFGGEVNGRHGQDQTLLHQIFDRQLDQPTIQEILLDGMQGHAAPAQPS